VYRVVQEAVNNILRHSGASKASIEVRKLEHAVEIVVQDNGKGLPVSAVRGNGFGLANVEQRVRMLNGTFLISSSPDRGTTITITLQVHR